MFQVFSVFNHIIRQMILSLTFYHGFLYSFLPTSSLSLFLVSVLQFSSVQFSSVAQSCPTLCNSMNRSTPGLPVHHQLLEFTQTRVHRVSDGIQPSHPRPSPSSPAPQSLPASKSFPMSQLRTCN